MPDTRFSIVIVTWNAIELLKQFLPSVTETDYPDYEIIIADNASTDETRSWIESRYPELKVVTFDKNYGYCGGNNRAVKYCSGDVIIFLNNDVKVDKNWLQPLNEAFKQPTLTIAQPKIKSYTDPDSFEYAGASGGFIDWLGYPFCRGRLFDTIEPDNGQYDDEAEIFWATGAAFAVRKEFFVRSGGFDESFEFHMEEIDLCWRCHHAGGNIKVIPASEVFHLGGGSMETGSPRKAYYNYRNSLLMLTKNLDRFLLPKLFLRLCLDGISGIRSLLLGNPAETFAIIKAHFGFYRRLPGVIRQRSREKQNRNQPVPKKLVHSRLIIFDYFLRRKKTFTELSG